MNEISKTVDFFSGHRLKLRHQTLKLRANLIQAIRSFFIENDYLEIETPIRIPEPTPEAFIDSISSDNWYLHTSPELCMKKLIASGLPKIFQICRCFRANERSDTHLSEFSLLEWYRRDSNYLHLMDECEKLIIYIAQKIGCYENLNYQGQTISLNLPWKRISVSKAFDKYASISLKDAVKKDQFDEVMVYEVEPALGKQPVFLYDYPKERAALARLKTDDSEIAERFELYIAGYELANAFSELTDPDIQRQRFALELGERKSIGKAIYPVPESFLQALKHLPETAGIALGIDRLVMIFADVSRIDDVVAFTSEELTS
ncbi:lysyl-tRNA synthetase [Candidatus Magnetomorum sp. HK-1]|nr:lysyl-tRNA synthetase [Candidatus Magnetomorum sp. HK-1]